MPHLEVASVEREGTVLQIVFVPPETTYFEDRQCDRLRQIILQALQGRALMGEMVIVWEHEGRVEYLGNPRWQSFVVESGYANLYALRNNSIGVK